MLSRQDPASSGSCITPELKYMPYELFLALRYLRSRRRRRLARITGALAGLGIAFGVASLIVALALTSGFQDEVRDRILSGTAHITVMRDVSGPFTDYRETAAKIQHVNGVTEAAIT